VDELHGRVVTSHGHQEGFGECGGDEVVDIWAEYRANSKHGHGYVDVIVGKFREQRFSLGLVLRILETFDRPNWKFLGQEVWIVGVRSINRRATEVTYLPDVRIRTGLQQICGSPNVYPPGRAAIVTGIHDIRQMNDRVDPMLSEQVWERFANIQMVEFDFV
jgi:hypothetical protein